jgi:hypothetical protein
MRAIEIEGSQPDVERLRDGVERLFEARADICLVDPCDDRNIYPTAHVRFEDDTDDMAHAFERGLLLFVRGFLDAKEGRLRVLEETDDDH